MLAVMASIPCAAYQVGHLHGTLRREHHSRMRAMSMSRHGIFEEKHSTYAHCDQLCYFGTFGVVVLVIVSIWLLGSLLVENSNM